MTRTEQKLTEADASVTPDHQKNLHKTEKYKGVENKMWLTISIKKNKQLKWLEQCMRVEQHSFLAHF